MDCAICLTDLVGGGDSGSGIDVARCGHPFHRTCFLQWREFKKQCPVCKVPVRDAEVHPLYLGDTPVSGSACSSSTTAGGGGPTARDDEATKTVLQAMKAEIAALRQRCRGLEKKAATLKVEVGEKVKELAVMSTTFQRAEDSRKTAEKVSGEQAAKILELQDELQKVHELMELRRLFQKGHSLPLTGVSAEAKDHHIRNQEKFLEWSKQQMEQLLEEKKDLQRQNDHLSATIASLRRRLSRRSSRTTDTTANTAEGRPHEVSRGVGADDAAARRASAISISSSSGSARCDKKRPRPSEVQESLAQSERGEDSTRRRLFSGQSSDSNGETLVANELFWDSVETSGELEGGTNADGEAACSSSSSPAVVPHGDSAVEMAQSLDVLQHSDLPGFEVEDALFDDAQTPGGLEETIEKPEGCEEDCELLAEEEVEKLLQDSSSARVALEPIGNSAVLPPRFANSLHCGSGPSAGRGGEASLFCAGSHSLPGNLITGVPAKIEVAEPSPWHGSELMHGMSSTAAAPPRPRGKHSFLNEAPGTYRALAAAEDFHPQMPLLRGPGAVNRGFQTTLGTYFKRPAGQR
eukprot:RCo041204